MQDNKKKKGFPDLNKDGKVTFKDILIGRGVIKKAKGGPLKGGQKKLDANKNGKIDSKDFAILKAEKAKGRGMGLQDEQLPPGKMVAAKKGKMIKKAKDMSKLHESRETTMEEGKETMMEEKGYKETKSGKMVKKMGGGMVDPTMANYQKGGSVQARGVKLARTRPTKLY